MTLHVAHKLAEENSPEYVNIPQTWGGVLVWAAGKWGVGIVFAAMLIPVYADLKDANKRASESTKANVQVLMALAQKIESGNERTARIEESIRRIESESNRKL